MPHEKGLKPVAAAPPPPAAAMSSPSIRRPYRIDAASDAAIRLAYDNNFGENGSIGHRNRYYPQYQMQSDYWAPAVLHRQLSCWCDSCSGDSVSAPVFSEGSGKNGVEEAL